MTSGPTETTPALGDSSGKNYCSYHELTSVEAKVVQLYYFSFTPINSLIRIYFVFIATLTTWRPQWLHTRLSTMEAMEGRLTPTTCWTHFPECYNSSTKCILITSNNNRHKWRRLWREPGCSPHQRYSRSFMLGNFKLPPTLNAISDG